MGILYASPDFLPDPEPAAPAPAFAPAFAHPGQALSPPAPPSDTQATIDRPVPDVLPAPEPRRAKVKP